MFKYLLFLHVYTVKHQNLARKKNRGFHKFEEIK